MHVFYSSLFAVKQVQWSFKCYF